MGGSGQGGEAEAWLAAGEGGRSLDEGLSVAKGAEPPLLGEELLVGHGVDGMREGEGGAARSKENMMIRIIIKTVDTLQMSTLFLQVSYLRPPTDRCPYELLAAELERELLM